MFSFPKPKERTRGLVLPNCSKDGPLAAGIALSAPHLCQGPLRHHWRLERWRVKYSFSGFPLPTVPFRLPSLALEAMQVSCPQTFLQPHPALPPQVMAPHLCFRCSGKFSLLGLCLCLSTCLEYDLSLLTPLLNPHPFLAPLQAQSANETDG